MALNRPGQVSIFRDPGGNETPVELKPQEPWVHAMRQQAINFLGALRSETTPLCEAAEAMKDLQIARDYMLLLKDGDLSA